MPENGSCLQPVCQGGPVTAPSAGDHGSPPGPTRSFFFFFFFSFDATI